jgi:hypothetical protein
LTILTKHIQSFIPGTGQLSQGYYYIARLIILTVGMIWVVPALAQDDFLIKANEAVDGQQKRIDFIDGLKDGEVQLLSELQTRMATDLYIYKVNRVQKNINNDNNIKPLDKKRILTDLNNILEKVDRENYFMYNATNIYFDMILKVQEVVDNNRIIALLKSDMVTSLNIIPFYDNKPYATDILKFAAKVQPSLLLNKFGDFAYLPYASDVLEEVCGYAPMHVSFYMGTNNPVFVTMDNAEGMSNISLMMNIFKRLGSNSRAYLMLDQLSKYEITINEAHQLGLDRDSVFSYLRKLREKETFLGAHSVDEELTFSSLQRIRRINELHEEKDPIRFRICDTIPLSSEELYTLMVYGEDEIYTSTFLGLFTRFMDRLTIESSYEFLHTVGMNRYRTFVKMCANYNTLPIFLSRMSEWEKRSLFNRLVGGLQDEISPLEQAVAVADTYGSLSNAEDREIFELALRKEYQSVRWSNRSAEKLYGILMSVLGVNEENADLLEDVKAASTIDNQFMFKNNEHVEQHFFFDDEDGWASYSSFIQRFRRSGWTIVDQGHYVLIKSTKGKSVKIYANKATHEYDGQQAIKALFKKKSRYADVVVHRGHSYYASATIQTITPNADLVILGSCGGYNNISTVLNYSPNAQIITSKQVGTLLVNNDLIFTICEYLRLGKDLEWETLWLDVRTSIKSNKLAVERFNDYLPPHKNLGAILIRNYRRAL